ncbi:MAG: hypothetical protein QXT67_08320 [Candidatus Bathyarchaeia archaeon]
MINKKGISTGGILSLLTLALMMGLSIWILSPALTRITSGGRAHLTASSAYVVGEVTLRITLINDGDTRLRLLSITVKDTNIEGSSSPGVSIEPGTSKEVDVGLSKGRISPGTTVTLTITVKTDKGTFTQQLTVKG